MVKPNRISNLPLGPGPFRDVVARAERLRAVERLIQVELGALGAHCRLANIAGSRLVLQTDSPAWASRVRYEAPRLLEQLKQHPELARLDAVSVTIAPPAATPAKAPKRRKPLSDSARATLRAAADSVSDPALGIALRRLADRYPTGTG